MSKTRIHVIILTDQRTEAFRRCVSNAFCSLTERDTVTVIDDSDTQCFWANSEILNGISSSCQYLHLSAARIEKRLRQGLPISETLWLDRSARRDIAPLRNVSLLLSLAEPAETTVLIDDDICGFDLSATHERVAFLARSDDAVIVGAQIGGLSEEDTITRIHEAVSRLDQQFGNLTDLKSLFRVNGRSATSAGSCRYVSAGYLAFRLTPEQIFAFPPGYNEDWLWCLLQSGNPRVRIDQSSQRVLHDPPFVLKPTHADLRFELLGDFIFECLEVQESVADSSIEFNLNHLSHQVPLPSFMPLVRVRDLLDRIESRFSKNHVRSLEEFGLTQMREMLETGELDIDGAASLKTWCKDAVAKQHAFAATLSNKHTMSILRSSVCKKE